MSALLDFYNGEPASDINGNFIDFTLEEIWQWPEYSLEACHEYIQWFFPTKEPSNFNPFAPILTDEDIQIWRANDELKEKLKTSTEVFLKFIGLILVEIDGCFLVNRASDFTDKKGFWTVPNHNWLRITRMLTSLRLLGLEEIASKCYYALCKLREDGYGGEESFRYWQEAANEI